MKKYLFLTFAACIVFPASIALANPYADYNEPYYEDGGYYGGGGGYYRGDGYARGGRHDRARPSFDNNANKSAYERMMNSISSNARNPQQQPMQDPYYAPHHPQAGYPAGYGAGYGAPPAPPLGAHPQQDYPHGHDGYAHQHYDSRASAQRAVDHAHHPTPYQSMEAEMSYESRQDAYRQQRQNGDTSGFRGQPTVFHSAENAEALERQRQVRYQRDLERGYDDSYRPVRTQQQQNTGQRGWR